MTKVELVKIGVPSAQAQGMKRLRRVRQILEQHDAAVARLNAHTNEKIREATTAVENEEDSDEPVAATA